jgi:hypothetical protein
MTDSNIKAFAYILFLILVLLTLYQIQTGNIINIADIASSNQLYSVETSNPTVTFHLSPAEITNVSLKKETSFVRPSPRKDMGVCQPTYGKVTFIVVVNEETYEKKYKVAQASLRCYLKSTNYELKVIKVETDERVKVSHFCIKLVLKVSGLTRS